MRIEDFRIGQRVEVTSSEDGAYTGTVDAILPEVGPDWDLRPGVHLKDCEGNPSQLTWAYAEQVLRVIG